MWRRSCMRHHFRTKALLLLIVILGAYVLLADPAGGGRGQARIPDDAIDLDRLRDEVENDGGGGDNVKKFKYVAPFKEGLFEHNASNDEKQHPPPKWKIRRRRLEGPNTRRLHAIWERADKAITRHSLWPKDDGQMQDILEALATARIVYVEAFDKEDYSSGTSEKWAITLEGGQKAMMKIVWESSSRGTMKDRGLCNYGHELPMAEIAAFHLHRVLDFRNTPYVVGRRVHLQNEILPVATPAAQKQLVVTDNTTCVRGQCYFCDHPDLLCPKDGFVEASIAYWIPRPLKLYTHPPRYMPFSTPNMDEWLPSGFNNKTYCRITQKYHPYELDWYYMDLFDFAVVDTLMYHYDSKHYVIYDDTPSRGLTIRLDHGRAFCAYDKDEEFVFMAPLKTCCTLRRSTYEKLSELKHGLLTRKFKAYLAQDPLAPILKDVWFPVMERRLRKIMDMMEDCSNANGEEHVLL